MTDDITKDMTTDDKLNFLINAFSDFKQRLITLEERFTSLENLVHARLTDTRPLWESVNMRLEAIEQRLDRLEQDQREQFDQLRQSLRQMEKKLGIVHQDNLELRVDVRDLDDRLEKLEKAA